MMTLRQLMATFPTNGDCKRYLQERRWPDGVVKCPRCGNEHVYGSKARPFHWQCTKCGPGPRKPYRFSVLVGTVFENTNYPLKTWFEVLWAMLNAKKGISALQIQRQIGCGSYRTAWFMCHRLRAGMRDDDFRKLMGIVEVDETFVGGKAKNRHIGDRFDGTKGTGGSGKAIVAGAVQRKGNVVARVIADVRAATLETFVRESVSTKVSLLCTDKWVGYKHLNREFPQHETIDHAAGQYVCGAVHTQTIEGFWSIFKRGVIGTFHKVSAKYLPLYVAEFQFRYNNRLNADIFGAAIREC
jgi:transposase-like protein